MHDTAVQSEWFLSPEEAARVEGGHRRMTALASNDSEPIHYQTVQKMSRGEGRAKSVLRMGWSRYTGKLGGTGWKNDLSGEIRYQDEQPKDGEEVSTEPVEINTDMFDGKDDGEVRKVAFRYAMDNLRKTPYENKATHLKIKIGRSGIEKTLSHSADIRQAMVLPHLPEIIAIAQPVGDAVVEPNDSNVIRYLYLDATIKIDGGIAESKLKIREMRDGYWYYDQHITGKPKK